MARSVLCLLMLAGSLLTAANGSCELTSPGSGILLPTVSLQSSFSRMVEFMNSLTRIVNSTSSARAVYSERNEAFLTEGQGYGLVIAASVAATTLNDERETALSYAHELFLGLKKMCELTDKRSCQGGGYICEGNPCLPAWKLESLEVAPNRSNAAGADADSILGMIIMVETSVGEGRPWWNEVAKWAYQRCKTFMDFNTILDSSGTKRTLRNGSCWGGWDCANPSYYSPAHYRVFRDYMLKYASRYATASEGLDYSIKWNGLINTVYLILEANQCPSTGLTTNWFIPNEADPSSGGSAECNGINGTPSAEFGSEAARSVWRVALDVFWFPEEATQGVGAATYSARVANQVISKMKTTNSSCLSTKCVGNLDTGCFVTSISPNWLDKGFMYGPTFSSLLPPLVGGEAADQQRVLDLAATKVDSAAISSYYSGSWTVLATLTLSGDLAALKPLLTGLI